MEIKNVGSRGTLFSFRDLGIITNVYVIEGNNHIYVVDTYLGPKIMESVSQYIKGRCADKPVIVINTHSHWDHVWGNSFYQSTLIIAHELCRKNMEIEGRETLEKYKHHQKGDVILTYPNLTFAGKIFFEDDGILVYHSPGHTDDSISIWDMKDRVLMAGDNLERPLPYLMSKDLQKYQATLEGYLSLEPEKVIGSHTDCEGKDLIIHNGEYIRDVMGENTDKYEKGDYGDIHRINMEWLLK